MNDNKLKAIIGLIGKEGLLSALIELQKRGIIKSCSSNFRCGYAEYLEEQFFAPFYVEFFNSEGWVIYSTNSIRSDRMTFQQWHTEHIKRINKNITRAFVVVPDSINENAKELQIARRYDEKIKNKEIYSPVDGILTQTEFVEMTSNYADTIH